MRKALATDLDEAMVDVSGFILLKVDLPDAYEAVINTTEVTKQENSYPIDVEYDEADPLV